MWTVTRLPENGAHMTTPDMLAETIDQLKSTLEETTALYIQSYQLIKDLHREGWSLRKIANHYGIPFPNVQKIVNGKSVRFNITQ
ncbi:hypothetical protein [Mycobacteroides abscessus]|uniref:hypothetical protein n=1 Tax=Mycobacteroides abscessus TaxID=36809 RepID=UPI0012FFFC44|nr:hypothetical protein [Mycobacteroides abscessus]